MTSTISVFHPATAVAPATTVTATVAAVELYFENEWSIYSSTSLLLVIAGILVMLIIGTTALSIVPVVVSTGAAVANGLCYYAFYSNYNWKAKTVAGAFADIGWGFQEIGLPFYSYFILRRILNGKERVFFMFAFWLLVTAAVSQRLSILVYRIFAAQNPEKSFVRIINIHHEANFSSIAAAEVLSAFFLLRKFRRSRRRAAGIGSTVNEGLIRQLARSTEIRVACMAFVGIGRAVTYSFMVAPIVPQNIPSEIDRFAAVCTAMFPMILYIDLLGSKVAGLKSHSRANSSDTSGILRQSGNSTRDSTGFLEKLRSPLRAATPLHSPGVGMDSISDDFPEYSGAELRSYFRRPSLFMMKQRPSVPTIYETNLNAATTTEV